MSMTEDHGHPSGADGTLRARQPALGTTAAGRRVPERAGASPVHPKPAMHPPPRRHGHGRLPLASPLRMGHGQRQRPPPRLWPVGGKTRRAQRLADTGATAGRQRALRWLFLAFPSILAASLSANDARGLETGTRAGYGRQRGQISEYHLDGPLRDVVTVVLVMGNEL